MRPRTLREQVAATRATWGTEDAVGSRIHEPWEALPSRVLPQRVQPRRGLFALPVKTLLHVLPRDIIMHIVYLLPTHLDIARIEATCRSFQAQLGYPRSVVADALILRAQSAGCTLRSAFTADLLRAEGMRSLAKLLRAEHGGLPLMHSLDTNTGYDGVTFREWAKPFAYYAAVDGNMLGSFSTAVAAAYAVAKYRYGLDWQSCRKTQGLAR